ncbi:serine/threonine protein kinase [Sporosarcina luteola]|nr:serine/threonine protein kinase [Sporosarcina luteola]
MKEYVHVFERKDLKISLNNYYFKSGLNLGKSIKVQDAFPFRYVLYDHFYHAQGWKIHLSPALDQYPLLLSEIVKVLQREMISFKYVPDLKSFLFLSNKNTSISQFGKYMTIYPKDKEEFMYIIEKLYSEIKCETGVTVPSDQKYKDSNFIYYRYGGVFPEYEVSNDNEWDYQIVDGFGEAGEDSRRGFFTLPPGIHDPFKNTVFDDEVVKEVKIKGSLTDHAFSVTKIIRHCATGNVYEGYDATSAKNIIIKEGRLGGFPSLKEPIYRAHKARMNEFEFFKENKMAYNLLFPQPIDYFYEDESIFIIVEKLDGMSLKEFITENPISKPEKNSEEKKEFIETLKNTFNEIFKFIMHLHSDGYVFNDISDDNFFITAEGKVALIDAESISKIDNNEWYEMGTDRFMYRMPKKIKSEYKDLYMFSQLMLYSVIGKNKGYFHDENYYEKEYGAIISQLPQGTRGIYKAGMMLRDIALNECLPDNIIVEFEEELYGKDHQTPADMSGVQLENKVIADIENIRRVLTRYYSNLFADNPHNIFKFRTSDYNNSRLSLVYGLPGVSLCLRELNIINDRQLIDTAYILQEFALKESNMNKLNDGLIFGKAGIALYLQQAGIPVENNYYFLNLVKRINRADHENLDLANGLSGIYMALSLIDKNQNYPDMSNLLTVLKDKLLTSTSPISQYQGLEYGSSGLAYCLTYGTSKDEYNWKAIYRFIEQDLDTVKEDPVFTGLSYSIQEWPNIRSPYLYAGGAGIILILLQHYHRQGESDWEVLREFISSLNSPFSYNYGITYGMAGLALVMIGVLLLPNIPEELKKEFEASLLHKINYITTHFHRNDEEGVVGFLGDKQSFYADDFGAGGLGILLVLKLYKEYSMSTLSWDNYKFSAFPILSSSKELQLSQNEISKLALV